MFTAFASLLVAAIAEIDAMVGATAVPGVSVQKPREVLDRQLLSVQELAGKLHRTEKTARRIGVESGARVQIEVQAFVRAKAMPGPPEGGPKTGNARPRGISSDRI